MIRFNELLIGDSSKTIELQDGLKVVVWNLTKRCNLTCLHCYINADSSYSDEIPTDVVKSVITNMASYGIKVILFSGGEPLLRPDIFELGIYAHSCGIHPVLSSNGCLITQSIAQKIKQANFEYVGISIDGTQDTHDRLRGKKGCFKKAINGLRILKKYGVKRGIRFTIHKENINDLPKVMDLAVREKIERFCLYHLVYTGRARQMLDINNEERKKVIEYLIQKTISLNKDRINMEILTTDNYCDGVFIYKYLQKDNQIKTDIVMKLLRSSSGCPAGDKIINIAPEGNVYPCQFWQSKQMSLGNIKDTDFSKILDSGGKLLNKLKQKKEYLKGRCFECAYRDLCIGCRIRAYTAYGDYWVEDPACYL